MGEPVLSRLLACGVVCPAPATVWVADDVKPEAIAPGVVLHPGCRLSGARTSIGPGCELGAEAPVTLDNAQLGHGVRLKGGYVAGSTLWDGVDLGSAGYVLARVNKVMPKEPLPATVERQNLQRYAELWSSEEARAYYELLKARFKAEILVPRPKPDETADGSGAAAQ